jgi:histidyl-tRNA synthetase
MNEVELTQIYLTVFEKLGIDVELRINHRKILAALAEFTTGSSTSTTTTTIIDKLDKIGIDKVNQELREKNLTEDQIAVVNEYLNISGNNDEKIENLLKTLDSELTISGTHDIKYLLGFFEKSEQVILDFTLARGLNYYTGIIFEIRAKGVNIGSIGGGGRYDDLTGLFGVPGIPGVGISFGVDRIYDVMDELKLFPTTVQKSTQVLFFNLGTEAASKSFKLMQSLRNRGVRCELYHETAKFDKQFKFAEKKHIPLVVLIGGDELKSENAKVRDLNLGTQKEYSFENLNESIIDYLNGDNILNHLV